MRLHFAAARTTLQVRTPEQKQAQVELSELQQKADALSQLYQTFLARHEEAMQQQSFPMPITSPESGNNCSTTGSCFMVL